MCASERASLRASVRACERASVRACERASVRASMRAWYASRKNDIQQHDRKLTNTKQ